MSNHGVYEVSIVLDQVHVHLGEARWLIVCFISAIACILVDFRFFAFTLIQYFIFQRGKTRHASILSMAVIKLYPCQNGVSYVVYIPEWCRHKQTLSTNYIQTYRLFISFRPRTIAVIFIPCKPLLRKSWSFRPYEHSVSVWNPFKLSKVNLSHDHFVIMIDSSK